MTLTHPASPVSASTPGPVAGATVAWGQVLPLAVVLAFANGFWIIALRGAVGAIERTSAPFNAWLWESALLVPVYVAAVMLAFVTALRWCGTRMPRRWSTLGVVGLVAACGAAAGVLLLTGSAVIDYHLQVAALDHMGDTHPGCDAACVAERKEATRRLQVDAVGVGAVLMLATDLVVVALAVAFRGGRVVLAGARAPRAGRVDPRSLLLAAALIGTAAIHTAVVREHLDEWAAAGVFFVTLAAAELAVALLVLLPRTRLRTPTLLAALAVSGMPLLVWTVSRTTGLPVGPQAGAREPAGIADVVSCLLEATAVVLAWSILRARTGAPAAGRAPRAWSPYRLSVALATVLAVTAVGLGATGVVGDSVTGGGGHADEDEREVLVER